MRSAKRRPFDELHHQRGQALGVLEPVDVRDVRMIECGQRSRFALRSGRDVRGRRETSCGQDLQRDIAIELRIARAIDLAHAARANARRSRAYGPMRVPDDKWHQCGIISAWSIDDGRLGFILEASASLYRMGLSIALAQLNPTVGDVAGNPALVRRARDQAAALGADLVVCSELVLVGYPPEDLVLRPALVEAAAPRCGSSSGETQRGLPALLVTLPWRADGCLHNAVALVADGRSELRFKHELPNYGVFDEKRVFTPGPLPAPVSFRGVRLGIPICEDIWFPAVTRAPRAGGRRAAAGAERIAVRGREVRPALDLARQRVANRAAPRLRESGWRTGRTGIRRRLVRHERRRLARAPAALLARVARDHAWQRRDDGYPLRRRGGLGRAAAARRVYNAMVLGLRDYVRKNGFRGVVLGLSGGIDSALTAAVAVDALGADRVRGVRLPSHFTTQREHGRCGGDGGAAGHAARDAVDRPGGGCR